MTKKMNVNDYLKQLDELRNQQQEMCMFFIQTMKLKRWDVEQMLDVVELLKDGLEYTKKKYKI